MKREKSPKYMVLPTELISAICICILFCCSEIDSNYRSVPAAPSNLSGYSHSTSSINLLWIDNSGNEEGFIVHGMLDSLLLPADTVAADIDRFIDTGLQESTRYSYCVYAFNSNGISHPSNYINVVTHASSFPNVPINPFPESGAVDVGINRSLSWYCSDPDRDPLVYDIYFGNTTNPPVLAVGVDSTHYNPGQLLLNAMYYWRINAIDSLQHLTEGNIWSFKTVDFAVIDSYFIWGSVRGVSVDDQYAYLAAGDSGLIILDISNPADAVLQGNYDPPPPGPSEDVDIKGDYAYLADGYSGLRIVNISDRADPFLVSTYDTPGHVNAVSINENYAYLADSWTGLQIIDISDALNPDSVAGLDTPGYSWDIKIVGRYAFVADDFSGMQIIDISDPLHPIIIGNYCTPMNVNGIDISGQYAYLASGDIGLYIVDISDPANPTLCGIWDTPHYSYDVRHATNYCYVADDNSGVQIIDVSNPYSPYLVRGLAIGGYSVAIEIMGQYIFVAADYAGFKILQYVP